MGVGSGVAEVQSAGFGSCLPTAAVWHLVCQALVCFVPLDWPILILVPSAEIPCSRSGQDFQIKRGSYFRKVMKWVKRGILMG